MTDIKKIILGTGNYYDALECVNVLIKHYNMTDVEYKEVLVFFDKYWNKFKDTKPVVIALQTNKVFSESMMKNNLINFIFENPHDYIFDVIVSGKSLLYDNFCVNQSINASDLNYFSLEQLMVNKNKQDNSEIKRGM